MWRAPCLTQISMFLWGQVEFTQNWALGSNGCHRWKRAFATSQHDSHQGFETIGFCASCIQFCGMYIARPHELAPRSLVILNPKSTILLVADGSCKWLHSVALSFPLACSSSWRVNSNTKKSDQSWQETWYCYNCFWQNVMIFWRSSKLIFGRCQFAKSNLKPY